MFLDRIDVISFTRALTSLSGIDSQSPPSASSGTSAIPQKFSTVSQKLTMSSKIIQTMNQLMVLLRLKRKVIGTGYMDSPWLFGMLGPELEAELSISFFLTFGFLEATESGVGSFYRK
jgi:hypothetical protein